MKIKQCMYIVRAKVSRKTKKRWMMMAADNHFALPRDPETLNRGSEEYGRGLYYALMLKSLTR